MKIIAGLCALIATHAVRGHEDHGKQDGETIQEYAKRHVRSLKLTESQIFADFTLA